MEVSKAQGIQWGVGAISTAKFGGVYLRDVLKSCGIDDFEGAGVEHVHVSDLCAPVYVYVCARGFVRLYGWNQQSFCE